MPMGSFVSATIPLGFHHSSSPKNQHLLCWLRNQPIEKTLGVLKQLVSDQAVFPKCEEEPSFMRKVGPLYGSSSH